MKHSGEHYGMERNDNFDLSNIMDIAMGFAAGAAMGGVADAALDAAVDECCTIL